MKGHTSERMKYTKPQLSRREVPSIEEDADQEETRCTEEFRSKKEASERKVALIELEILNSIQEIHPGGEEPRPLVPYTVK